MNHPTLRRMTALVLLLALAHPSSAQTTLDDLILYDPSPDIAFDDSDTAGRTYRIRGFNEYFIIRDEATMNSFIRYVPNLESIAIGRGATAVGDLSSAVGANAHANGHLSGAVGRFATSDGSASLALGYNANASGNRATAVGYYAFAPNPDIIVLGSIPGVNGASSYANVGMGTSTPSQAVDVERSGTAARFQLTSYTNTANEAPQYIQRRARGTRTAPSALQSNDNLGLFSFRGYTPGGFGGSRATITAQAAGNFSNSSTPTRLIFATTPVGQTTPQQVLVITPDGKVQVNGQNLNVPDYVFEDDYDLMPLDKLRTFIDENGHLPGIASASEVNEGGLDLAGSHLDHLRKIEELTLYTLEQAEHIARQQANIERLERQMAAVLARVGLGEGIDPADIDP